ncbi:7653_t:CDS:2 [Diversispora eburnea]|uniref:deoxyhypusine synthase n=2 Tax=Diversisporales TaxID=214509 RepID=A0A9N9B355_9GLOM|nr:7653_t:CDS:2 [Diversispora eburnea]
MVLLESVTQDKEKEKIMVPDSATQAVLVHSTPMSEDAITVIGPDFNQKLTYDQILRSYDRIGFQATSVGKAIQIINQMRKWRLSDDPISPDEKDELKDPSIRSTIKCKIFLGYTSNLVSSGLREIFRYLVQHSQVDVIVTTAGGVEEDFIKCLASTYLGEFHLPGVELRKKGLNRIGNLIVPNDNYCKFEDWIVPILDQLLKEQKDEGTIWSPSKIIDRLGKEINNPESIYYWAHKNKIPVYCPAITDGSIGDMIYFHSFRNPGLLLDIVSDIRSINDQAVFARKTGMIILGGGRNGADYAVYINTGHEFDGSDSGARPDEAVSWGKIKMNADSVKIHSDATIVFPLIVAETFAKEI